MMPKRRSRLAALCLVLILPAWAQYPGQVKAAKKPVSSIRAIGVLEWTGDPGKPKASRIIPIAVFDGEIYQPGGLYLARPEPLAVQPGTEYVLQSGITRGLFDVNSAQDVNGYWFGYGAWKPMLTAPKRVKAKQGARIPQVVGESGATVRTSRTAMRIAAPAGASGSASTRRFLFEP